SAAASLAGSNRRQPRWRAPIGGSLVGGLGARARLQLAASSSGLRLGFAWRARARPRLAGSGANLAGGPGLERGRDLSLSPRGSGTWRFGFGGGLSLTTGAGWLGARARPASAGSAGERGLGRQARLQQLARAWPPGASRGGDGMGPKWAKPARGAGFTRGWRGGALQLGAGVGVPKMLAGRFFSWVFFCF